MAISFSPVWLKKPVSMLAILWTVIIATSLLLNLFQMEPIYSTDQSKKIITILVHGLFLVVGLSGVFLSAWRISLYIKEHEQTKENLRQTNRCLEVTMAYTKELTEQTKSAKYIDNQFLTNMNHEIRTSMNAVVGMTGLLLDSDLTPKQREFLNIIRISVDVLLGLINDILDFSKIQAGNLDVEIRDFNLWILLAEINEVMKIKAREKNLEYHHAIDSNVPAILRGDPERLRQIITNLTNNAIKFTHQGEVVVKVSLQCEDEQQATIRFVISDTGIGISKEKRTKLFTAFMPPDSTPNKKYEGMGLGLFISKRLIEMMGGSIGLDSAKNIGTTFWFTIVCGKSNASHKFGSRIKKDIRGARILIVDDNTTNRRLLAAMTNSWGCRYDEAPDGVIALDKLAAAAAAGDPFVITILDMKMLEMNGEMLGAKIKKAPNLRDTALVMITSIGNRDDAQRFIAAGFAAYLIKPVKHTQLYDCLCEVYGEKKHSVEKSLSRIIAVPVVKKNNLHEIRILLVEDNQINQIVAMAMLKKQGFSADAVANGLEAIKSLEEIFYDLVLMDCQMPEMDGFEATRAIRASVTVRNPQIPIIAMTANVLKGDREKCFDAGMNDYLSKPVNPKDFHNMLEKWIVRADSSSSV
ncbi:hypothetical protein CCP3SC5AM1_1310003 [Gammaproteobacteria bacterium]